MPGSQIDLGGLRVAAEDFLAAVLATAAQPIWVIDPRGVIRFVNPAALTALGYDSAEELLGRRGHDTIHYRHPDGSPYPASEWPLLRPRATGETVANDLDWFVRRDGSMFPVSYVSAPIEVPEGRGAVVAFTDIAARLRAEREVRERDARQASLRRVSTLVAGGAALAEVLTAVASEVALVLGLAFVGLWRYEPGGTATVVCSWSDRPHPLKPGTRWPLDGPEIATQVEHTGRPVRIDDLSDISGTIAAAVREVGTRSGTGAPIIVHGRVWGAIAAYRADPEPLPDQVEDRLAEFTPLIATAISNVQARAEAQRLTDEQGALRRVATLVATERSPAQVFAAVAEEVGQILGVDSAHLCRYETEASAIVVGAWSRIDSEVSIGTRAPLEGENIIALVHRTGRPARIDDYAKTSGSVGALGRRLGIRSAVGTPILVDGRLWGAMVASSRAAEPLPSDAELRIAKFTELVATAISNIQARTDLAASRARIVAAADDERRRVVRDLHDGAQQRLVQTILTLKLAHSALLPNQEPAGELVTEALEHAERATLELRELARGILPAVLTQGGLRAAVAALASRAPIPVEVSLSVDRLPAAVEATAYFVVAEALTNVAKHARATSATVLARVEDGTLRVQVRDDGIGGAQPDDGGLVGLADRLAVLDGQLRVESPADGGTVVAADIPLHG